MKKKDEEKVYKSWNDKCKDLVADRIDNKVINPTFWKAADIDPYYNLHPEFEEACNIANFRKNIKNFFRDYLTAKAHAGQRRSKIYSPVL